jgi:D-alanyl-D-alanine dipeptidase
MKYKLLFFTAVACFLIEESASAEGVMNVKELKKSQQMIVVVTSEWDADQGILKRFERSSKKQDWKVVGEAIPVVVGKHGMAWDSAFSSIADKDPIKKEGDGRTPVGIYEVGPSFGFDEKATYKLNYFPLTETSVCVDDVKSAYYNQLLDSAKVPKKDWDSGEQMRAVPQYQIGGVIQYNAYPSVAGRGSCIFMHIWKDSSAGTAGCVAMDEANLKQVLTWLDANKKPVIVMFPLSAYKSIKKSVKLPNMLG